MSVRGTLKLAILGPLALATLAVCVANRITVPLYIDPFTVENTTPFLQLPLYLVMLGCLAVGVLMGGIVVWFGQGKHRRAARAARKDVERLSKDLEDAKRSLNAAPAQDGPRATPLSLAHI
jgi:uncharacterized integral membrane protein